MKRILLISGFSLFSFLMAFTSITAQEIKHEKKIKVILVDDSGKKTVIDTLIKDRNMSDTIKLQKGKIIVIDDNKTGSEHSSKGGTEYITVNVTSDDNDSLEVHKDVRVLTSDSLTWHDSDDSGHSENIYVFKSSSPHGENTESHQNTMTWTENDGKKAGKRVIVINDGEATHTEEHEIIMHMDSEEGKKDFEKTKYIIKKDGMVISVEGDDYNKVKEIVEEIESTLESKKNVNEKDASTAADSSKDKKKK